MPNVKKTAKENEETVDFEQSLRDLEEIVRKMEHGELTLENSLEAFEEGVRLTRNCQAALQKAEQKVNILVKNSDGEFSLTDFNSTSD